MAGIGERPIRIRWEGSCVTCRALVPARSYGWWDIEAKQLTCLTCRPDPAAGVPAPTVADPPAVGAAPTPMVVAREPLEAVPDDGSEPPAPAPPAATTPELTDEERGTPGASARAEGERRSKKREARIRTKHPRLGGLMLAVTDDPTTTKVWAQGAVGEERIGAFLDASRSKGIEVLHDRRVPRSKANLDHLVVAPTGIWIVDPKRYLKGRLERRDLGGWRKTDLRLFVGGRDKTKLVETMRWQIEQVQAALADTAHATVPVHGALCFVDTELGFFAKPFTIDGVLVTWRKHLLAPLLDVQAGAVPIDESERAAIARHLVDHFKPA